MHRGGRREDAVRVLRDLEQKEIGISNSAERALELIKATRATIGA
jgi:hypothetical protein